MSESESERVEFVITFPESSPAEATSASQELAELMLNKVDDVSATIRRDRADTQDLGSTLVLLFGSGAAVAIAKGLQVFLAKRGTKIKITGPAGEIVISGDVAKPEEVVAAAVKLLKR